MTGPRHDRSIIGPCPMDARQPTRGAGDAARAPAAARRTSAAAAARDPARRDRRLPRVPAARGVARGGRADEAPRRFATRSTGPGRCPGFGDPEARVLVARARAGRARRQPHRPGLHRRPVRRLPLRRAPPGRVREPADVRRGAATASSLRDAYVAAAVRCAPPGNRPTTDERDRCLPFLVREIDAARRPPRHRRARRVRAGTPRSGRSRTSARRPRPRPRFGHGAEARVGGLRLSAATTRASRTRSPAALTPAMIDAVLARAAELAALPLDGSVEDGDGRRDGGPRVG